MNPYQMQTIANAIAAQNRAQAFGLSGTDGQPFINKESVTIRITNSSTTTKHTARIFDPGNFYGLNTGTTNSSDITIEGIDKKHKMIERRMVVETWTFVGMQLKVDAGKESQFANNLKLYRDNAFNDESPFKFAVKPSPYKTANQFQANIADINKVFSLDYFSALLLAIEPNTTVDITMYVGHRHRAKGV